MDAYPLALPVRRDHLSPEQRSQAMSRVRRRDTSAELTLRSALWRANVRGWRCDVGSLPGRPDLAWGRWRVAVFIDGRLWHGHPSRYPARLNAAWREKIARNIERDRRADRSLAKAGWSVLRFWDHDVARNPHGCVEQIEHALNHAKGHDGD